MAGEKLSEKPTQDWVLVPREPTEEMLKAGRSPFMAALDPFYSRNEPCGPIYRAMIEVAPPAPGDEKGKGGENSASLTGPGSHASHEAPSDRHPKGEDPSRMSLEDRASYVSQEIDLIPEFGPHRYEFILHHLRAASGLGPSGEHPIAQDNP